MKLSKHQKEIVEKIISGEVYNVYSYLKVFDKGSTVKYDIDELRRKFELSERGKTYKVMKEGHSTLQNIPRQINTPMGTFASISMPMLRTRESITDDEWEEKEAEFVVDIPAVKIEFDQETYSFDFKDKGVFVAKDFDAIIDFITLWTYLKQQSLVVEVSKPIKAEDVGIFFQLQSLVSTDESSRVKWSADFNVSEPSVLSNFFCDDIQNETTKRKANSFMKKRWMLNEDYKSMCSEFVGKRIIANTSLRVFSKSGYKTENEKSQRNSMAVALIAVGLSLISLFAGSVLPLFQPKEIDYLNAIHEQLLEIQEDMYNFQENSNTEELEQRLADISALIDRIAEGDSKFRDEIDKKVDAINKSLLGEK